MAGSTAVEPTPVRCCTNTADGVPLLSTTPMREESESVALASWTQLASMLVVVATRTQHVSVCTCVPAIDTVRVKFCVPWKRDGSPPEGAASPVAAVACAPVATIARTSAPEAELALPPVAVTAHTGAAVAALATPPAALMALPVFTVSVPVAALALPPAPVSATPVPAVAALATPPAAASAAVTLAVAVAADALPPVAATAQTGAAVAADATPPAALMAVTEATVSVPLDALALPPAADTSRTIEPVAALESAPVAASATDEVGVPDAALAPAPVAVTFVVPPLDRARIGMRYAGEPHPTGGLDMPTASPGPDSVRPFPLASVVPESACSGNQQYSDPRCTLEKRIDAS